MNIGVISGHGCIRAQKQCLGLSNRGHHVHFISHDLPSFAGFFDTMSIYYSVDQLRKSIKLLDPHVDIWHVRNEPNYYVSLVREVSIKPVILDVHDSYVARMTKDEHVSLLEIGEKALRVNSDELHNMHAADALVFPGEGFMKIVVDEYHLTQKCIVVPSMVPSSMFNYEASMWMDGICYEGRVDLPEETKAPGKQGYNYSDYTGFSEECFEKGIDFFVYPTRSDEPFKKAYEKALVSKPQKYDKLIKSLSGHAWGLVGNPNQAQEWKIALPNKLFEYISAGTPIASFYAPECEKMLESFGIGIAVKSIDELKERWDEHEECRRNLIKYRFKLAMENNLEELEELYNELIKHGRKHN